METVRCSVNCWAQFGDLLSGRVLHTGDEVLFTTGSSDLFLFSCQGKKMEAVLQFDAPVTSLALSADRSHVYALCQNKGLYCGSLSLKACSHSQSAEKSDDCLPTTSRDCIDIVIKDGKVQSFILVESIIVTASLQGSFWSFDLYEVPSCSSGAALYHKCTGFQVPAVATTTPQDTGNASLAPILTCVYPHKDSASNRHTSQCHFFLEPLLFRLLFGVEASLVHSPVILCGLPDGRLVSFPLRLPACGGQKPRFRMLHSLEQPVSFIGTSVTGEQGPHCLIVVGQMGRIILISADQARSDGKAVESRFSEQNMRGPVVCACTDGEHLYYSTSNNLLAVPLSKAVTSTSSLTTAEGEGLSTRSESSLLLSQSAICLSVCQVIALAEPSFTPTGCVQLLALSLSGRLLQVTVPQNSEKDTISRLTSSQVGQTVKDLLAGIGNVWERASSLKLQLQLKNNILKRLNQVINICNLLLTYQKRDQKYSHGTPPISCHGITNWSTLLQKDTLVLTCTLENCCDFALDQGWSLSIELRLPHSLKSEHTSRTYSFALKKLDSGQKMQVSLPLESQGEVFLPVRVHCFLVYSLHSLLYSEESLHLSACETPVSQILTNKNCISLALNTLVLDWLDCLRIGEPDLFGEIPKQRTALEATKVFLNSRQLHTEDQTMPKPGPLVLVVQISLEFLKTRLGFHNCTSAILCISVLKWLLPTTSEAGGQNPVKNPVVCAYGPKRQPVRLLTKEVILSDVSSEGPLHVVEIQVESFSLAAVCGLHHAILQRVQTLLNKAPVKCESPTQLKGQCLLEVVRHAESLYIKHSQASTAFDEVKRTNSESWFHLYLKLREKPLVIL